MDAAPAGAVVFELDRQRYALPIEVVDRIARAVELTPLPGAPPIVRGVIDVGGDVLPVLSLRLRFGLVDRALRVSDALLLVRTPRRRAALLVDDIAGMTDAIGWQTVQAGPLDERIRHLPGAVRLDDGLVLIHDIETLLSADDEQQIARAMQARRDAAR